MIAVLTGVLNSTTLNTFEDMTVTRHHGQRYDEEGKEDDPAAFYGHELVFRTVVDVESAVKTLTGSVASIVEAIWSEMHAEETATPVTEYRSPVTHEALQLCSDPSHRLTSLALPDGTTLTTENMHCEAVFGRLVVPGNSYPITLGVGRVDDEDDEDSTAPTEDSNGDVADVSATLRQFWVEIFHEVPPEIVNDRTNGMRTWMKPITEAGLEGEGSEDNLETRV